MALVTHIIGITLMAGATFIDFVSFRSLSKVLSTNRAKALVLEESLRKLQRVMGIGMLIILASGVMMMVRLHELWGAQIWFRIKMGMLALIIINGLLLRRRVGSNLNKALFQETVGDNFRKVKTYFMIIQLVQLILFIVVYVLSVFKFN
jgi:hypothetical protein